MSKRNGRRKRGFSLVEVCLAMLVVGLGLLSIFGLFPTGLAASEDAEADTTASLFANQVLNGLQAQADDLKPMAGDGQALINQAWIDWGKNVFVNPYKTGQAVLLGPPDYVAYYLTVDTPANPAVKQVTLYVLPWKGIDAPTAGLIRNKGLVFYTELYFTVLP